MTKTRFMLSNGLAFSERKDMENLRKKALEGWQLKKFRTFGFELEKANPEDIIFSIDYRKLKSEEEAEYFNMFEAAGWSHVCSEGTMHVFKAAVGTVPIYSDSDSSFDKLKRLEKMVGKATVYIIGVAFLLLIIRLLTTGIVEEISRFAFATSFMFTVPAIMTYGAVQYHKWKLKKQFD